MSLFLFPRTFFLDLVWIPPVVVLCTFQVIAKLGSPTSYVFSSEWRGSCNVIRIKYIHVIFLTRQTVLAARLVFSEDWVLVVTAAFGQRKRILRKIEIRKNGHNKENSTWIQGCQNKSATGAFHRLFWILRRLLRMLAGQFRAWYWGNIKVLFEQTREANKQINFFFWDYV